MSTKVLTKPRTQKVIPTEEHKTNMGQRAVNLIWENTQARIALFVIICGMAVNAIVVIACILLIKEITVIQLALISLCLQFINYTSGIVIGFYFSRTNHQAIGGVGRKPLQKYRGR